MPATLRAGHEPTYTGLVLLATHLPRRQPMPRFSALLISTLAVFLVPSAMAEAANRDRFQVNHEIRISPDDKVADVTCINCSVYVRARVSGDVVTVHGNVTVEQGASIAGDLTAVGGEARLESGSQLAGDVVAVGVPAARRLPGSFGHPGCLADTAQPAPRCSSLVHHAQELRRQTVCHPCPYVVD